METRTHDVAVATELTPRFDAFLSYNSYDQAQAESLAHELQKMGLRVWIDTQELAPGREFQPQLEKALGGISSALVLIGARDQGRWQRKEVAVCIDESTLRSFSVIPVLLPGAAGVEYLPAMLRQFTAVDLRDGITAAGLARLRWGITSCRMTETSGAVVTVRARLDQPGRGHGRLDAWGVAAVKSRMHAYSEVVARAASEEAARAAATYPRDLLTVLVPVTFELRWRRGYLAAIEKLLRVPQARERLRDFGPEEMPDGSPVAEGMVSARVGDDGEVSVLLDGQPAVVLRDVDPARRTDVVESINAHGRLGAVGQGTKTLIERVGEIALRAPEAVAGGPDAALFANREVLATLIARFGMPGDTWLLVADEQDPDEREPAAAPQVVSTGGAERAEEDRKVWARPDTEALRKALTRDIEPRQEEVFDARKVATGPWSLLRQLGL